MKIGVSNERLIVDFSRLRDYLRRLGKKQKAKYGEENKKKERSRAVVSLKDIIHRSYWIDEVSKAIEQLSSDSTSFLADLNEILSTFSYSEDFPEDAKDLFMEEITAESPDGKIEKEWIGKAETPIIFDSHIVPEVKDVFSIEKKLIDEDKWLFDTVTIKGDGDILFKKCLMSIPLLKNETQILKKKKQFSARYTFRPYPLAVLLWLVDESSISIPSDLRSFLQGAISYFFSSEWRTSIVLSAISVESMLADFYEEKFKKPAPDIALGDLLHKVKKKISFPQEVSNSINITNKARIAAVHRSPFPVSDKEAINALYGATSFILWYSSQF